MSRTGDFNGKARLYTPFILAFLVFFVVLGAEYVMVGNLIDDCIIQEANRYHGLLSQIMDGTGRYEAEADSSITNDSLEISILSHALGLNNYFVQIMHEPEEYTAYLQHRSTHGLSLLPMAYNSAIIETSIGKTEIGETIVLEVHDYQNEIIKNLEIIATGLLLSAFVMLILAIVPGALLIESLARRSKMMNSLAPALSTNSNDVLRAGLANSTGAAFIIASPHGAIIAASDSCVKLLEIGDGLKGLSMGSIISLPDEVRRMKPSDYHGIHKEVITIYGMSGSAKDCLLEVHPFKSGGKTVSVLFLFVTSSLSYEAGDTEPSAMDISADNVNNRAKIHLVKSLIHNMNNHLSGIIGLIAIELDRSSIPATTKSLEAVLESVEKVTGICNDLQNTVVGGSERRLRDVFHEINLIVEVLRKILPGRVEIEVTGTCNKCIRAGRELLREFYYGLALNSVEMMNGEGRIRIDVSERIPLSGNVIEIIPPGNKICIRYSDGYIMPVALRDVLSNRNYSLADVERQYGSSIGNAYKALTDLTGTIVFERGSGETILCILIDGFDKEKAVSITPGQLKGQKDSKGLTILVADAVEIVLHSTSEYLEQSGMNITRARDGDRVMELLKNNSFDAVVLDLNMPGAPTQGIVRFCQTSRPDMAIVIASGFSAPHGIAELINSPSTAYLHKPHRPKVLMDLIHSLRRRLKEGS